MKYQPVHQITESQSRLYESILRDLGTINKFLEDDNVNEIMVNSNNKMFIDTATNGLVYIEDVPSEKTLRIIKSLSDYSGQVINISTQFVTLEMPVYKTMNGERFTAQIPPLVPSPSFTLRKKPKNVYPLESYVASGRMTQQQCDSLIEAMQPGTLEDNHPGLAMIYSEKLVTGDTERDKAENRTMLNLSRESRLSEPPMNIVFCGGPGSGKTAATNSCIKKAVEINPHQRFLIIEKLMSEIQCRGDHVHRQISNHVVSMRKCVEIAMVSRPDRIILGEVKGEEALEMCKAWNTGTPGGMSTIHADNPLQCFQRIGDLCLEAGLLTPPWGLILSVVNVVVWVGKHGSQKGYIKEILFNKGSEHEETKFLSKIKFEKV